MMMTLFMGCSVRATKKFLFKTKIILNHMTYSLCPIGQKSLPDHAQLTSARFILNW